MLPTITIQSGTYNSNLVLWRKVLESVKVQDYPKNKIEHIVFDKGSTNGCDVLAKKYGCKIIVRNDPFDKAQMSAAIGVQIAKGELIVVLESDNIVTSKKWLREMVQPFLDNKKVICTYSMHNSYESNMNAATRYCALMGSPDPTLYYLKKTEKMRMDQHFYDKGKILDETSGYYLVRFTSRNLPTLGDNGHMFRKKQMVSVIKNPESYTHTDAFMGLVNKGYDTFGVVKNSIIHVMQPDIRYLVQSRVRIKSIYTDGRRGRRKYLVFNHNSIQDVVMLVLFVLYSLTLIEPLYVSLRGYIRIRDRAWFLHPLFCVLMTVAYGYSEFVFAANNIRKNFIAHDKK